MVEEKTRDALGSVCGIEVPLASRRASGDAGHVPGCVRDHALDRGCVVPSGEPGEPDIEFVRLPEALRSRIGRALDALSTFERLAAHARLGHEAVNAFARVREILVGDEPSDPHEAALRRVQDARAALPETLRRAYSLDEAQVATVLRVADALAAGVDVEARAGVVLEALGRASVAPPDADLARVIAAWPVLAPLDKTVVVRRAERGEEWHWRTVAECTLSPVDAQPADCVWLTLYWKNRRVVGCEVEGQEATPEQWAKLRAAGVPVADGVGV